MIKERGTIVQGSEDSPPGFCKVFIPKYLEGDVKDLPEAEIQGPVGNRQNEGSGWQVQKGDFVWVELHGSEAKPKTLKVIVVGSAYSAPDGLPNMPHDGFDGLLTLHNRHLIPRDAEGNVHEDFEAPKRYAKGRAIPIFVKEGISFVVQNGQLALTHLRTLTHLFFTESGTIDLFSTRNLFLRAKKNLHIWGNKVSFKSKTLEMNLDDFEIILKKFGIDAKQITLESGGLAKILAAAVQLTATGDFFASSGGASLSMSELGLFSFKSHLLSLGLKPDILDKMLDHLKTILEFVDEYLTEYISHIHPCVTPTGPPTTATKMIVLQVQVQMEIVKVDLTKVTLGLIME